MAKVSLATFTHGACSRQAGMVVTDRIAALSALVDAAGQDRFARLRSASVFDLLDDWDRSLPLLVALAEAAMTAAGVVWLEVSAAQLHAPVETPRQIFCTGANYRTHVIYLTMDLKVGPDGIEGDELRRWGGNMMDERIAHGEPYVFTKPVSAIAGPNDPLYCLR